MGEELTIPQRLVQLLVNQMDAKPEQVVIYNEGWKLPADNDWYLVISFDYQQPYAHSRKTYIDVPTTADAGLLECQRMNVREVYKFDLFSSSRAARYRMNDIEFALNSDEAERLMAAHAFRIANLPLSFNDVSHVEGAARLSRYQATFNLLTVHTRVRNTLFYDKFTVPPQITVSQ